MLSIDRLVKNYGETKALDGVSLSVDRNSAVAIVGPSGSGKSTLLRCVAALEDYQGGSVLIDGELIGYAETHGRRRRLGDASLARQRADIGMVFQSLNLFPHLTALQNVMLGLIHVRRRPIREAREIATNWLERVGLVTRLSAYPRELSGGQQQRVAIARAAAMEPKLLLLDEITSALDPELVGEVLRVVEDLAARGVTMAIVTHEIGFALDVSQELFFMDAGQVVESGNPRSLIQNPKTDRMRIFLERFTSGMRS